MNFRFVYYFNNQILNSWTIGWQLLVVYYFFFSLLEWCSFGPLAYRDDQKKWQFEGAPNEVSLDVCKTGASWLCWCVDVSAPKWPFFLTIPIRKVAAWSLFIYISINSLKLLDPLGYRVGLFIHLSLKKSKSINSKEFKKFFKKKQLNNDLYSGKLTIL